MSETSRTAQSGSHASEEFSEPKASVFYGLWHIDGEMGLLRVEAGFGQDALHALHAQGEEGQAVSTLLTAAEVRMIQQAVLPEGPSGLDPEAESMAGRLERGDPDEMLATRREAAELLRQLGAQKNRACLKRDTYLLRLRSICQHDCGGDWNDRGELRCRRCEVVMAASLPVSEQI